MIRTHDDIMIVAGKFVSLRNMAALRDPACHYPHWHEHSLLAHCAAVCSAAAYLRMETGVDITLAAAYHDLGKFAMFDAVMAGEAEPFTGHEALSAAMAAEDGVPAEALFAIREHGAAYRKGVGFDPVRFAALACGDRDALVQLVGLCAADAVGKGWTPAQARQRPRIARLLRDVARDALGDVRLARIVNRAVRTW